MTKGRFTARERRIYHAGGFRLEGRPSLAPATPSVVTLSDRGRCRHAATVKGSSEAVGQRLERALNTVRRTRHRRPHAAN